MKVALACPYAWDAPGGVQAHVRHLGEKLRARGHDVLVLAPARRAPAEGWVLEVGRPVGIPYNGSVAPVCVSASSARRVRRELRGFAPDIVHAHEPLIPGTGLFATLASPAPVVGTFHAFAERAVLYSAVAPVLRRVWRRLAARLAVSRASAGFVERRFGDGVRVVPNGTELERFQGVSPAPLPEGSAVLFVGRLEPRKGLSVLVKALPALLRRRPDAFLVVVGDGPERDVVRRLPQEMRERVLMEGRVPDDALPSYHAGADVFCAPAVGGEGFGIVLVEAMAAGLPVVASDIPGYREVVRDGAEGVLVPPGDPEALAAAIAALLDDPLYARQLGEAGRQRARRYSWDVVAEEIETVYREALEPHGA